MTLSYKLVIAALIKTGNKFTLVRIQFLNLQMQKRSSHSLKLDQSSTILAKILKESHLQRRTYTNLMNTTKEVTSSLQNAQKAVDFQLILKVVSNMITNSPWFLVKMELIFPSGRFTRKTEFLKPKNSYHKQTLKLKISSKRSSPECLLRMLKCSKRAA